jgi:hypothetical protein
MPFFKKKAPPLQPRPLSSQERQAVLRQAYVPEHLPGLMEAISGAEAQQIGPYFGYAKDSWAIFIGYPLEKQPDPPSIDDCLDAWITLAHPRTLWFIGPEIPEMLLQEGQARQSDLYYRLDLENYQPDRALARGVRKASQSLAVGSGQAYTREHEGLVEEFTSQQPLPPLVAGLYKAMPAYCSRCPEAQVLEARDPTGRLSAFFVVDRSAASFDTYILGGYSRFAYIPHASDLLFSEMVRQAQGSGKATIQLGLGVNDGIRRFKTKWGGCPYLAYEFCEFHPPASPGMAFLQALMGDEL